MYRRIILILIIICLWAAYCQLGCRSIKHQDKEEAAAQKINIIEPYRSVYFIPLYVTIEEGFFAREGLEVEVETAPDQEKAAKNFIDGKGQFLLAGPEVALYQYQQDRNKKLIILARTGAVNGSLLLARKKTPALAWPDFKGKVIIGSSEGEIPYLLLKHILVSHGLRPLQDVHLIYNLPLRAAGGAFIGGSGDYLLAMEPLASRMERDHGFQVITSLGREYPLPLSSALMVRTDYLADNKAVCNKFLVAFQQGLEWVDSHSPEEIVSSIKKHFPADDEKLLLRSVSRYKTLGCWPRSLFLEEESLNTLQELMLAQKELKAKIPPETILDNSLAQKAPEKKQ